MNRVANLLQITPIEVPVSTLVINLVLSAVLSLILSWFYEKYGRSLSNRSRLARNFVLISITTALVITIVKASLALSLGLVGALSIVRFRAAIKEPEELAYIFLAIAIGLGFGADQGLATVASFTVIMTIVFLQTRLRQKKHKENLFLTLALSKNPKDSHLDDVLDLISGHVYSLDLTRVDDSKNKLELGCLVEFESSQELQALLEALRKKFPNSETTMIDPSGLV